MKHFLSIATTCVLFAGSAFAGDNIQWQDLRNLPKAGSVYDGIKWEDLSHLMAPSPAVVGAIIGSGPQTYTVWQNGPFITIDKL